MNKSQQFFSKYELPLFLLLTYVLSWWSAPLMNGPIIPYGPAIAAVIVWESQQGSRDLANYGVESHTGVFPSFGSSQVRQSSSAITRLAL